MRFKVINTFTFEGKRYEKGQVAEIPADKVDLLRKLGYLGGPARAKREKAVKEGETR